MIAQDLIVMQSHKNLFEPCLHDIRNLSSNTWDKYFAKPNSQQLRGIYEAITFWTNNNNLEDPLSKQNDRYRNHNIDLFKESYAKAYWMGEPDEDDDEDEKDFYKQATTWNHNECSLLYNLGGFMYWSEPNDEKWLDTHPWESWEEDIAYYEKSEAETGTKNGIEELLQRFGHLDTYLEVPVGQRETWLRKNVFKLY